jgi:adenine-specific DNA-methyltransferase
MPVAGGPANAAHAPSDGPFVRERTVGDPSNPNRLYVGDNVGVLGAMRTEYEGRFHCIYLDPPFNTGRLFEQYDDARKPREWLQMMRERLVLMHPLLAHDGAIFVEIDDTELGPLQVLMDEIFGRSQRVSTVTIVRSASTGHKAKNRGPVNVTDFLLIYEKSRGAWKCRQQERVRETFDRAYATFLVNPEASRDRWIFEPLARRVAETHGFSTAAKAIRHVGKAAFRETLRLFALDHADHVVRFAQPRYEAVSKEAQAMIRLSRAQPELVMRLERPRHPEMILKGGNRMLFLSRKVRRTPDGPRIVEPLTNVWDDVPFQGIAKEGGVVFARNKKPERLLARVLSMSTGERDWVLDPFLGSGTTAAVAHKMSRHWVGVERGQQALELCVPRLTRVVDGCDATGVTRTFRWQGGGGFGVYV